MQEIDGRTETLGLLGNPVAHTLSPAIHNTLSEMLNRNQVYLPFPVASEELRQAVEGAFSLHVRGLNVTVPHKRQVMEYVTELDPAAEAIGAVNTLVRQETGYKGYNTDMPGLLRALQSEGVELSGKTAVILGAGGASKAAAYLCMQEGAERVFMLNRTLAKAQAIADSMNRLFSGDVDGRMRAMPLEAWRELPDRDWIVFQCTSVGLFPHTDEVVLSEPEFYRHIAVGIDLIYNPAETRFMRLVREAGGRACNGLNMLLYQGIIAYELWNGVSISQEQAETVYDRLYELLHPSGSNLVLIGFMGSGKTTVGRRLAELSGYAFLDTDAYIEQQEGRTIPAIFEACGEAYFRQAETRALTGLTARTTHTVIATGGGMPLRRENARLLRELGQVVYLQTGEETVRARLQDSQDRPLLQGADPAGRIHALLQEREPLYSRAAHMRIGTDGRQPEQIAEEILQRITE